MSSTASKEKTGTKFDNWLKSQRSLDIIVYTYISQEMDESTNSTGTGIK